MNIRVILRLVEYLCTFVEFILSCLGYGNTQNVPLGMLFLSNGEDAVNKQIEVAENDSIVDYEVKPESGNRFVKRVVKNVKSNTIAKSKVNIDLYTLYLRIVCASFNISLRHCFVIYCNGILLRVDL